MNKSLHGKVQLVWQLPTYHAVKYMLHNQVYAGAYVHGQRHTTLALGDDNSVRKSMCGSATTTLGCCSPITMNPLSVGRCLHTING